MESGPSVNETKRDEKILREGVIGHRAARIIPGDTVIAVGDVYTEDGKRLIIRKGTEVKVKAFSFEKRKGITLEGYNGTFSAKKFFPLRDRKIKKAPLLGAFVAGAITAAGLGGYLSSESDSHREQPSMVDVKACPKPMTMLDDLIDQVKAEIKGENK